MRALAKLAVTQLAAGAAALPLGARLRELSYTIRCLGEEQVFAGSFPMALAIARGTTALLVTCLLVGHVLPAVVAARHARNEDALGRLFAWQVRLSVAEVALVGWALLCLTSDMVLAQHGLNCLPAD